MPAIKEGVYLFPAESKKLRAEARAKGVSVSNLIRLKLDLPEIKRGAPIGNKYATKKKKPASKKKPAKPRS
jgi:hypothetical protein